MAPPELPWSELETALCRYVADHPNAKDTLDGIRRWWISEYKGPSDEVETLLNLLVTRTWMQRWSAVGVHVYGLNPAALPEIEWFLESDSGEVR